MPASRRAGRSGPRPTESVEVIGGAIGPCAETPCWSTPQRLSIRCVSELTTARGPIDTADLGVTLMHEHVFIMTTEIALNYPEAWGDEDKRVADAVARLNELKSRGVDTIVDLTVIGLGRYIPRIARVAAER